MTEETYLQDLQRRIKALTAENADYRRVAEEHGRQLQYLERMERIGRVLRTTADLEEVLNQLLGCVREIFECDRTWMVYPCDPEASAWRVPVEDASPDYPGIGALGGEIPLTGQGAGIFREALDSPEPVIYGIDGRQLTEKAREFGVRSMLAIAIHPRTGKPWLFGVHQCSYDRRWTADERRLFKDISHRLEEALTSLLFAHDLQRSHEELEQKVAARTAELEASNRRLRKQAAERLQVEEELRRSREQYRELADQLPQIIFEADAQGRLIFVNRQAYETTGYSEQELAAGLNAVDLLVPEDRQRARRNIARVLAGEKLSGNEYTVRRRDGGTFPALVFSSYAINDDRTPVLRGIIIDLTERRRTEAELLKIRNLESLGMLAGGLAHDFNNLLAAILGNVSLAREYLQSNHPAGDLLSEMEKAVLRARELTRQLLTFSRGGAPLLRPTSLPHLIKDSASFTLSGSSAQCVFRLPEDLWPVTADSGQLSQVVQNLVKNAEQVMSGGGVIRIEAGNRELDEQQIPPLPAGRYVHLRIIDQGAGISEEDLGRIFDPYFTGRKGGTGLGLAIVFSIIRNHRGHIYAESGGGETVLHCFLPAADQQPVEEKREDPGEPLVAAGRILVMDDEKIVRRTVGRMLTRLGYEVECVSDGEQAITAYRTALEEGNLFDCVIMDLTVRGGMGGRETIRELLAIDPGVKALVSSGYANDPVLADYQRHGFQGTVPKPYRVQELGAALAGVLRPPGREQQEEQQEE